MCVGADAPKRKFPRREARDRQPGTHRTGIAPPENGNIPPRRRIRRSRRKGYWVAKVENTNESKEKRVEAQEKEEGDDRHPVRELHLGSRPPYEDPEARKGKSG